jgi:hypothetical protein
MILLSSGIIVSIVTAVAFWMLLPSDGQRHRWVDTEVEPYINVALCAGVALSFTMILSGVLNLISSTT